MIIIINTYRLGDESALSNIITRCLREINSKDLTKEQLEYLIDLFLPNKIIEEAKDIKSLIFVAFLNGDIVGTVTVTQNRIRSFFVDPEKHKMGIGRALISHAENNIKKNNFSFSYLTSSIYAVPFYLKCGYTIEGDFFDPKIGKMIKMTKEYLS